MTEPVHEFMKQYAPWPTELQDLVEKCTYRPQWSVSLEIIDRDYADPADMKHPIGGGLTLIIATRGYDSYHPENGPVYGVNHYFIVPAATYSRAAWQRWLFEQFAKVELHETMEFFTIDGVKVFAPNHAPGEDPYVVHEPTTEDLRNTNFRGMLNFKTPLQQYEEGRAARVEGLRGTGAIIVGTALKAAAAGEEVQIRI
jgi:hypothetical protein